MKKIILFVVLASAVACGGGSTPVTPNPDPTSVNLAPTAYGTVDKDNGLITDTFIFNSGDSQDDAAGLQSRLDSNGDGVYETSYAPIGTINYKYTVDGNKDPVIEVKDVGGKTDTYQLGHVGVLDPENNPITIDFQAPKYIVAGNEIKITAIGTDKNDRPLLYSFDLTGDSFLNEIDGSNQKTLTYTAAAVGKKTLEAIATNDYNISNNTTKDVEVGSPIAYTEILTDDIDGKKYKINMMNDGRAWLVENFAGKIGDASFYENDSINNSVFGRYYRAAQVDEIGTRVMTGSDGVKHNLYVASEAEWLNLININGGEGIGGGGH